LAGGSVRRHAPGMVVMVRGAAARFDRHFDSLSFRPMGMKNIERRLESTLFASRWLLAPLYLGLALVLVLIAVQFVIEVVHLLPQALHMEESKLVLFALSLVDLVLLANLVLMVMLSGYEHLVSTIDVAAANRPAWLVKLDSNGLKVKLFGSIVGISAIQVLRAFMDLGTMRNADPAQLAEHRTTLGWMLAAHGVFVLSALAVAVGARLTHHGHGDEKGSS